jgi:hypothetical protein
MLEAVVVCKEGLVVMHVMCCTAIFDPYAVYFWNTSVDRCFAAVCETTEYCVVGGSAAISICICISQICCLWIISTSTASTTSSLGTTPLIELILIKLILGLISSGLLGIHHQNRDLPIEYIDK